MSGPARIVEQSLFPDIQPDKPVGPILPSVFSGSNAELIAAVAPFYLRGHIMDCTYGEGSWWQNYRPNHFTTHDLKTDGVDFTALPESDCTYDTVCFDPPYIASGGLTTATGGGADLRARFGVTARSESALWQLIADGMAEASRVLQSRGYLLVKCGDYVGSGRFVLGHKRVLDFADALGLSVHDLIVHHTGSGPGGHNIFIPKRARRAHSYLIVFVKP